MKWEAKIIKHKKKNIIAVLFEENTDLIEHIKQVQGSLWSQSLQYWHWPDTLKNRIRFQLQTPEINVLCQEKREQITKFYQ